MITDNVMVGRGNTISVPYSVLFRYMKITPSDGPLSLGTDIKSGPSEFKARVLFNSQ